MSLENENKLLADDATLRADLADQIDASKGAALVGFDGQTSADVLRNAKSMSSYAELRAYTGRATGVRITAPGITGVFHRVDSNTTSPDDSGVTLIDGLNRRWKRRFSGPVCVDWFGAKDQATIVAAIQYAMLNNAELYWSGTYTSKANIPNFHTVIHNGDGIIKRDNDTFYITPQGDTLCILYTGAGGTAGNDGISADKPISIGKARDFFRNLGPKASSGQWRMQFVAGTATDDGVTFYDFPFFSKPLQIYGIMENSVRTAIWDGAQASAAYAIRADKNTNALNLKFRYLKFINWKRGEDKNVGAICCWYGVNIETYSIEVRNSTVAVWCRGGRSQHYADVISGCYWAYGLQYCHSAVVGALDGDSGQDKLKNVYISDCAIGVFLGRESIAHIDYTHFTRNGIDIIAAQKSRAATNNSEFSNWGTVSIRLESDSIHEENDSVWDPTSITDEKPIYHFGNGSAVPDQHFGPLPYRTQHYVPNSTFSWNGTERTLLSSQPGFGSPLRIRKQMLYSNGSLHIQIKALMQFNSNRASRLIELTGPGATANYLIGNLEIPPEVGTAMITFDVYFRAGSAVVWATAESDNPVINSTKKFSLVSSSNLNSIRDKTNEPALWRLYGTLNDATDSAGLIMLTTNVTG